MRAASQMVEILLKDYTQAYGFKSVIFDYLNAAGAYPEGILEEDHDQNSSDSSSIINCIRQKKANCNFWYRLFYPRRYLYSRLYSRR